jgi:putative endonuclease
MARRQTKPLSARLVAPARAFARALAWAIFSRTPRTRDECAKALGRRGEALAAKFLIAAGYRVIARNARVPMGEADLLCQSPARDCLVVVEVKSRIRAADAPAQSNATPPEAAITQRKRAKLAAIAAHLARANSFDPAAVRVDVVAVEIFEHDDRPPIIRHHVGIMRR